MKAREWKMTDAEATGTIMSVDPNILTVRVGDENVFIRVGSRIHGWHYVATGPEGNEYLTRHSMNRSSHGTGGPPLKLGQRIKI